MGKKESIIPIKNLFYMLCYAWNILNIKDEVQVDGDDYEDAYDLLARVFSFGIGKLIRLGFHRSYIEETEELSMLRGKISIGDSINSMSMQRKRLVCTYDEYSSNDMFNQILNYTMDSLLRNSEVSRETKAKIKKQKVFFGGIETKPPTKENRQKLSFNRNNVIYKLLIHISIMIYEGTAVNEEEGTLVFKDFWREEQMHRIFELFILNFYALHLDRHCYRVHAPKITWKIEETAADIWGDIFDVDENPGDRRTDIVIENKKRKIQMIFDAKYYKKTLVTSYMEQKEERVRSSHLNQIRGYLLDSEYQGKKVGALLYPTVNHDLSKGKVFPIQDTPILIKTINLQAEWREIEEDMLNFVNKIEMAADRIGS